ncbi:unnamed protein product [Soboliphyme baturini]|uniref:Zf-3CxxC domain-containing protein n=1 Tax=Soboliphyme baturini TaxID=241478 RepID=A0A183IEY2_9BILA|nr:unnamed protein product [Soboliphyme baturini]
MATAATREACERLFFASSRCCQKHTDTCLGWVINKQAVVWIRSARRSRSEVEHCSNCLPVDKSFLPALTRDDDGSAADG